MIYFLVPYLRKRCTQLKCLVYFTNVISRTESVLKLSYYLNDTFKVCALLNALTLHFPSRYSNLTMETPDQCVPVFVHVCLYFTHCSGVFTVDLEQVK